MIGAMFLKKVTSKAKLKISKFSGEIPSSQASLEASLWNMIKATLNLNGVIGKRGREASEQPVLNFALLITASRKATSIVK